MAQAPTRPHLLRDRRAAWSRGKPYLYPGWDEVKERRSAPRIGVGGGAATGVCGQDRVGGCRRRSSRCSTRTVSSLGPKRGPHRILASVCPRPALREGCDKDGSPCGRLSDSTLASYTPSVHPVHLIPSLAIRGEAARGQDFEPMRLIRRWNKAVRDAASRTDLAEPRSTSPPGQSHAFSCAPSGFVCECEDRSDLQRMHSSAATRSSPAPSGSSPSTPRVSCQSAAERPDAGGGGG